MLFTPTTWSNTMRNLLGVCRRLDEDWRGDLVAAICLFMMVPVVLFLGTLLHGGM